MVYDLLGQCLNQIIVHEKRALRLLNFAKAGEPKEKMGNLATLSYDFSVRPPVRTE